MISTGFFDPIPFSKTIDYRFTELMGFRATIIQSYRALSEPQKEQKGFVRLTIHNEPTEGEREDFNQCMAVVDMMMENTLEFKEKLYNR